jgi:cyanophycinase-like exopeptidase
MTKQLKDYMIELATDVDRLAEFMRDPNAAVKNADLSEADGVTLVSGDQGRIYSALKNLPTPPPAPPPPVPQLPTVVAAQYAYGAAAQGAGAAPPGLAPQAQYAQAAQPWPNAYYGQAGQTPAAVYGVPIYYLLGWPGQSYYR